MITQQQGKKKIDNVSSSTNKIILDHLLYLSIQSRLNQLFEYNNKKQPLQTQQYNENNNSKNNNKVVDSLVTGILSSHQNNKKSKFLTASTTTATTKDNFNRRLHLCQFTDMIFGRYDASSFYHSYYLNHYHRQQRKKSSFSTSTVTKHIYFQSALPYHCRHHRLLSCHTCNPPLIISDQSHSVVPPSSSHQTNNNTTILIQVIPLFLKISADYFRHHFNYHPQQQNDADNSNGGLPQSWYDLFLNLLTQAAIEAYLCDGHIGIKSILDIFSYCYMNDDDDDSDSESDNSISEEKDKENNSNIHNNQNYYNEQQQQGDDDEDDDDDDDDDDDSPFHLSWLLNTADYHLLFPKTRSTVLFKTQVCQREQEFLIAREGLTLQDHFHQLALKYPVEIFDKKIREFIETILNTMDLPILEKDRKKMISTTTFTSSSSSNSNPSFNHVYNNDDGSLLMPDMGEPNHILSPHHHISTTKRRHSFDDIIFHKKKQKQY